MRKKFEEIAKLGKKHAEITKNSKNPQTIGSHLQKLAEEFGELSQSVNKITGLKSIKKTENLQMVNDNILEEAADCIQIIFIIAHLAGHSYDDVKKRLGEKNEDYERFINKKLNGKEKSYS